MFIDTYWDIIKIVWITTGVITALIFSYNCALKKNSITLLDLVVVIGGVIVVGGVLGFVIPLAFGITKLVEVLDDIEIKLK